MSDSLNPLKTKSKEEKKPEIQVEGVEEALARLKEFRIRCKENFDRAIRKAGLEMLRGIIKKRPAGTGRHLRRRWSGK